MENLWQTAFNSIPHFLHGTTGSDRADQERVNDTIDRLVDDSDPRLRLVSSYRRQLRGPMKTALAHVDKLIERIPGPVEVCARAFSSDPQVTAFFTNVDELRRVYCNSEAIRNFFTTPEFGDADECHALLCMARDEKQVFGVGLEGGSIRREIPQTLVNFGDHQLLSPSPNEQCARQTLHRCLLGALLRQAGSGLVSGIGKRRALQSQQHQLHNHLRALQQRPGTEQQQAETSKALAVVEQDLKALQSSLGDINGHLRTLIQGLEQAPDAIHVDNCDLRISRTHVKLDLEQKHDGILLSLAEVHLGHEPPKVVSLTRYPRNEFHPATTPPPLL